MTKISCVAFLSALLFLSGCTDPFGAKVSPSNMSLELTLATPASPATRSMIESEESHIKDLRVLLFNGSGSLITEIPSNGMQLNLSGNNPTVKIKIDEDWLNQSVQFMLLANLSDNLTDVLDLSDGRSKAEILSDLKFAQDAIWPVDGTRYFPMYGTVSLTLSKTGIPAQTVYMLRSVARVQFWLDKDGNNVGRGLTYHNEETGNEEELFHLSSIRVYYSRKGGYIAPLVSYTNEQRTINEPSHPEDFEQRGMSDPLIYTLDDSDKYHFIRSIYIPENNNITPGDDKPVHLVVGGHYKGSPTETYYKVEFKDNATGDYYDCLRNHTYDFNITAVTGPGNNTPEDASGSEIEVVVTPWEESNLADVNMRMYEFSVSRSMITVNSKAHDEEITVGSTYGGTYPNGLHWQYDGAESNVGNETNWFSVEVTETGLVIHIGANFGTTDNMGSFTISSGALTKRIYISQSSLQTGNCYMVAEPGLHSLYALNLGNGPYGNTGDDGVSLSQSLNTANPAVYNNNGTINAGAVKSCRLIWQSRPGLITHVGPEGYNTATHPNQDNILTDEGLLAYTVGEPLSGELGGNAVIGIFDASGNCIWSWHIWVVWDYNSEEHDLHFLTSGVRSGFYFQELNLGAMVNEPDNSASFGLLYQWGRKDPMRSTNDLNTPYGFTPTYDFNGNENSSKWHNWAAGTNIQEIITSVQNPMSLASKWGAGSSASGNLWGNPYGSMETSDSGADNSQNNLGEGGGPYNGRQVWNEGKKSIYDPCPVGYRVPSINGFYFGIEGMALTVRSKDNPTSFQNIYSYCNLDNVGTSSKGYEIYYFGQYKNYEKYYTWMPMTPYYADGDATALTSPMAGSEGFAYTWLNCLTMVTKGGSGGAECIAWHPVNYHIHNYAEYGVAQKNAGTIRCVRETDPDIVSVTLPDKVALLADAGSTMTFAVLSNMEYWVEVNNLTYDWVTAEIDGTTGLVTVRSTKPNLTANDREAYIYVCLSNGDKKPVKVYQAGVSIGADEIKVGSSEGDSKSVSFTIPAGGSLSLPISEDDNFTYTLSNSGQNYTITVTAKNANPSPVDIVENGFYLNLSDDENNITQMPITIVQSKYTIGTGAIVVPYWGNDANNRKGTAYFVPPVGPTPTLYVWNGTQYVEGSADDRFTYTLVYGKYKINGKDTQCYALTATCTYPNYGNQRQRTVQIDLDGNRFDVDIIQNLGTPMATTAVTVSNNGGDIKLQTNLPTNGKVGGAGPLKDVPLLDGFTWRLVADESDDWLGLSEAPARGYTTSVNYGFGDKFAITHAESNFPGEERTTTLKLEFTQTATEDVFTVEIPVTQAEGNPFKDGSSMTVDKGANKNVQITWADGWKNLQNNKWSWQITNAAAAPAWLNLTVTSGNNVNGQDKIIIGTTAEKNQTGSARTFVALFEFQKLGPGGNPEPHSDPIMIPVTITQNK